MSDAPRPENLSREGDEAREGDTLPAPDPPPSVLDTFGGELPRVVLRDEETEHPGSRFVDAQATGDAVPLGRGNYQIHGEIARGGMGEIIKARDTDLGREVAIKVLAPGMAEKPFVLRRFVEEAQIGGQLQHPGVVPVYEMGLMGDKRPYFAMKLVKGRTLAALLSARKQLTDDRRRHLAIFESVCQTMAYAHAKGVVHRDLKPANVMVGAFGEVLVVDWGLAKVLGQGGVADEKRAMVDNRTIIETVRSGPGSAGSDSIVGSVMGTPAYMAPEQAMGDVERVDERSDVFSLGAILCEILTGKPPYVDGEGGGDLPVVVRAAQGHLEPARARIEACDADDELKQICLQCLTPAPTVRPRNAEELAHRVHDYLANLAEKAHRAEVEATAARVEAAGQRRAHRLQLALAGAVILALLSTGGALWWTGKQREERIAETRQGLDEAQSQVFALQQDERWEDALGVAEASLASVRASEYADSAMVDQAERAVALAHERLDAARAREELAERNARLIDRLETLRSQQLEAFVNNRLEVFDQRFHQAFLEYGVDLTVDDVRPALDVFRENGVAKDAVAALDDWASVRRNTMGRDSLEAAQLTMLAIDLDGVELHTRVREAILESDIDAMLAFARDARDLDFGPEMMWMLSSALFSLGKRDESRALVDLACRRFPDDYLLNLVAGQQYGQLGRFDRAIAHCQAAAVLRPESAYAHERLGLTLMQIGDAAAAISVLQECVRLDPESSSAHQMVGWALWDLGRLDESAEALAEAARLDPDDYEKQIDLMSVECQAGRVDPDALLDEIESSRTRHVGTLLGPCQALFGRTDLTPEQTRRTAELARITIGVSAGEMAAWLTRIDAALDLEQPEEALDLLEEARRSIGVVSENVWTHVDLLEARAWHMLGEGEQAERALESAERRWERVTFLREDDWVGSFHQAHLREVQELLGS